MVNYLSRSPLDIVAQNALLIPKVALSDSILQLVTTDTIQGDPRKLDNQPKEHHKLVTNSKLYHVIIARFALRPWFQTCTS